MMTKATEKFVGLPAFLRGVLSGLLGLSFLILLNVLFSSGLGLALLLLTAFTIFCFLLGRLLLTLISELTDNKLLQKETEDLIPLNKKD